MDSDNNKNVDINKKNKEDYEELINNSKQNLDTYWDKDNKFIKLLLCVLAIIIIIGLTYYTIKYFNYK